MAMPHVYPKLLFLKISGNLNNLYELNIDQKNYAVAS